jgi:uncharacterized membrane protein
MKREFSLDFLRGVAVLLMIITHVVAFFHDFSDPFLNAISNVGATVSFTVFLFCSGAVLPYTLLKDRIEDEKLTKYLKRTLLILASYYLICLIAFFPDLKSFSLLNFLEVLFLIKVPLYAEFLLAFVLFSLFSLLFRKKLKTFKDNLHLVIAVSAAFYVVGAAIWLLQLEGLPLFLKSISALFTGYKNWHRFPLFEYMPIFLIGLYYGSLFQKEDFERARSKFVLALNSFLFAFITILLILVTGIIFLQDFGKLNDYFLFSKERFPPSIRFLAIGLMFNFGALAVYFGIETYGERVAQKLNAFLTSISKMLQFLGENVFLYFFWHTVALYVIINLFVIQLASWWQGVGFTFGLILLCTLLVHLSGFVSRLLNNLNISSKK